MGIGIAYLNGPRLARSMFAASDWVAAGREEINRINVFPVPDSDTGTNLASTMRSIAERARASRSANATLGSIADAALLGARGNSGLIFAQFLYGLSREIPNETRLSAHRSAEAARKAVQHARRAVLTPVEGTMITLLHDGPRRSTNSVSR